MAANRFSASGIQDWGRNPKGQRINQVSGCCSSGRHSQPETQHPLTWLILCPFGFLPQSWIPLALNLFAAICASVVLGLLARSVALLRHDVTRDDPFRKENQPSILLTPTAWIPPVLAATVCGLQL